MRHERQNWRPFARAVFVPLRSALLRLVGILPLQGTVTAAGMLSLVRSLTNEASPHSDYQTIDGVASNTLPREWHDLVHDHADDKQAFNRRQLEVVAILELVTAIKAGEIFVSGSLRFDRFWDRLPSEAADPATIAAYATARGWGDGADGLVFAVKKALAQQLEQSPLGAAGPPGQAACHEPLTHQKTSLERPEGDRHPGYRATVPSPVQPVEPNFQDPGPS